MANEDVFASKCSKCSRKIHIGEIIQSFNLCQVVAFTVLWAQQLAIYCDTCAESTTAQTQERSSVCKDCKKTIEQGETKWTISYDKELVEGRSCLYSLESEEVALYCESCARTLATENLAPCCPLARP